NYFIITAFISSFFNFLLHKTVSIKYLKNIIMANSRLARLFMEVAPPQYVTVMRHRTRKMLDTITEEERETSSSSDSSSAASSPKGSSPLSPSSPSSSSSPAAAAIASANNNGKYFLKEVHRSLSILNH
ncbi:hypothetical protein S245_011219, partial [Arachis hypogaea]